MCPGRACVPEGHGRRLPNSCRRLRPDSARTAANAGSFVSRRSAATSRRRGNGGAGGGIGGTAGGRSTEVIAHWGYSFTRIRILECGQRTALNRSQDFFEELAVGAGVGGGLVGGGPDFDPFDHDRAVEAGRF